jgi:hypothetical protein
LPSHPLGILSTGKEGGEMNDLLGWGALIAIYGTMMGVLRMYWRRSDRAFQAKQAAWLSEHEAQTAELAQQRHLRELEERRRGLLRGRDRPCRFCGVERGCLTPDDVCLDVEACLSRAGVSTVTGERSLVD